MIGAVVESARIWWLARKGGRGWSSRAAFDHHQQGRLARWTARWGKRWDGLKVVDKAWTAEHFARLNTAGLTHDQARDVADGEGIHKGLFVGGSTGTSGTRGFYVLTRGDRLKWVAAMVGLCKPRLGERVAVVLPRTSTLYDAADKSRLIKVKVFNASVDPHTWARDLEDFSPDHIVAPPRALLWMVRQGLVLPKVRKVWVAGERCDPMDREVLGAHFPEVGSVYMATEGLMGVSCRYGRLHLCEDSTFFEFADAGHGLVHPIVSGFRRDGQFMARYKMNDLLRLSERPCPCGSIHQGVDEVVGRDDDVLTLRTAAGHEVQVPPSVVRDAVVAHLPKGNDFRVRQTARDHIVLVTRPVVPSLADRLVRSLEAALLPFGGVATIVHKEDSLVFDPSRKLSRVEGLATTQRLAGMATALPDDDTKAV